MLEGVPRIHFYEGGPFCPEDICFPSALKTCLEFMGDPIGCKHTSPPTRGWPPAAIRIWWARPARRSRFVWSPDWEFRNAIRSLAAVTDDAPYRRALDSVGYGCEIVRKEPGRDNEAVFRERISRQHRPERGGRSSPSASSVRPKPRSSPATMPAAIMPAATC